MNAREEPEQMYNVMIVEDEHYLLEELTHTMDWEHYNCRVCGSFTNAEAAIENASNERIDLVITDIRLPGTDGLDMLRRIEHGTAILITGHDQFDYVREALRIGVTDFLLKPIDDNEFYIALRNAVLHLSGMRESSSSHSDSHSDSMKYTDSKTRFIRFAYRFIEHHYREDVSLLEAAKNIGLSESYLSRIFKEKTGITFVEALKHHRIKTAKTLLPDPSLRIDEIAHMCGFRDSGYFCRVFKKFTGMTPGAYRCTIL